MTEPLRLQAGGLAVVTMELQRGVVGDLATHPQLVAAAAPILGNVATLCRAARSVGAHVVHATMGFRPDAAGFTTNSPIQRASARANAALLAQGAPGAELVAEIGAEPSDVISSRHTGMTPFTGTDLHEGLQGLGVETIVATGVSVNIGVLGLVISAADLGYRIVVPRDAVAGMPDAYVDAVLSNSIGLLATLTTTDAVVEALSA